MFAFITGHIGDIAVLLVLALLAGAVIVRMIKDRKTGSGGCGCGCKGCANAPYCHPQKDVKTS